jgi:hypothetical protein
MSTPVLLTLAAMLGATLVAFRSLPSGWGERAAGWLDHRWTPIGVGAATALLTLWVAGGTLHVEPISTDEAAYLLQARIFARGAAAAPAPPIIEFFEQAWVVVEPRMFAKYPPGHSLALMPGVAVGLPWLMPFLLNGAIGALLFMLGRRAAGAPAAALAWSAWVLSGMAMAWQTSYFSEVTLLATWLVAAWCTWQWLDGGPRRWLVAAALAAGFGVLTRPLSILLLLLPLLIPVLRRAQVGRRWREVGAATLIGGAALLVLPAWNLATTGEAGRSPLRSYTETYLPWDRLGFAIDSTAALRPPPPDLAGIAPHLARVHRAHTIERLPATLLERAERVADLLFGHWRGLFIGLALIGIWRLRAAAWVALAAAIAQFLGHAPWGHEAGWTIYYAESAAAWFLPGAVGMVVLIGWLGRRSAPQSDRPEQRTALAVVLLLPLLLYHSVENSAPYREWRARRAADSRALTDLVEAGPGRAIYFVRYGPLTSGRPGLIRNDPWLATARDWIVYDLGARNDELRRMAPERVAFLVDVAGRTVTPLPPLPTP